MIEPESLICACGGCLHRTGEDVSERLDVVPAHFRVIVTRRPVYACRACTDGIVQAPAPAQLIQAGLPTEATVAYGLVSKYADHLPLYRQAQIMSRQGIDLDRSTLADWATKKVLDLHNIVSGMCFDRFGERGHMGKTMDLLGMAQDVDDVLDKLVIYHLSPDELEEADAEWAHESQFYPTDDISGDDMGSHPRV